MNVTEAVDKVIPQAPIGRVKRWLRWTSAGNRSLRSFVRCRLLRLRFAILLAIWYKESESASNRCRPLPLTNSLALQTINHQPTRTQQQPCISTSSSSQSSSLPPLPNQQKRTRPTRSSPETSTAGAWVRKSRLLNAHQSTN